MLGNMGNMGNIGNMVGNVGNVGKGKGAYQYQGILEKLSNRGLKWNKRHVVCTMKGDIDYHKVNKKSEMASVVPKARFSLCGATIESNTRHTNKHSKNNQRYAFAVCVFVHVKKKGRVKVRLTFAADRFDRRHGWIQFLKMAIAAANGKTNTSDKENVPSNFNVAGRTRANTLGDLWGSRANTMPPPRKNTYPSHMPRDESPTNEFVPARPRSTTHESVTTIDDFLENTSPSYAQVPKSPSSSADSVNLEDCQVSLRDGPIPASPKLSWNDKFQSLYQSELNSVPAASTSAATTKLVALQKLIQQFNQMVLANAKQIIEDHPKELGQRQLRPLQHFPGQPLKEIYSVDGVVYSFTHHLPRQSPNVDQQLLEEEWKMKMATQELHGIEVYIRSGVPSLCTALCALVDYLGFRMLAVASLPIYDDKTLVVGIVKSGRQTIFRLEPSVDALLQQAATSINIKGHVVSVGSVDTPDDIRLWAAQDIRVHECEDDNIYVTRLSGMLPPDYDASTDSTRLPGVSWRNKVFRREFVSSYKKRLNSDAHGKAAMLKAQPFDSELDQAKKQKYLQEKLEDDAEVSHAAQHLRQHVIPEFVRKLNMLIVLPRSGECLCKQMHEAGINIRYLGVIARTCELPFIKKLTTTQMVARVCKVILGRRLRIGARKAGTLSIRQHITSFVTQLFSTSQESQEVWEEIEQHMQRKFQHCVSRESSSSSETLQQQVIHNVDFLCALENRCGLVLNTASATHLLRQSSELSPSPAVQPEQVEPLVEEVVPRLKSAATARFECFFNVDLSSSESERCRTATKRCQLQQRLHAQKMQIVKDGLTKKQGGLLNLHLLNQLTKFEEESHNYKRSLKFANQALHLLQDQPTYMAYTESTNTFINCVSVFGKIFDSNHESKTDDMLPRPKPTPTKVVEFKCWPAAPEHSRQRSNTAPLHTGQAECLLGGNFRSPINNITRDRSSTNTSRGRGFNGVINKTSYLQTITAWYMQVTEMMRSCDEHPLQVQLLWRFHEAFLKVEKYDSALDSVEMASCLAIKLFGKSHVLSRKYLSYLVLLYTQRQCATHLWSRSTSHATVKIVSYVWEHVRDNLTIEDTMPGIWANFGPPLPRNEDRNQASQRYALTKLALSEELKLMSKSDTFQDILPAIKKSVKAQSNAMSSRKIRGAMANVISTVMESCPHEYLKSLLSQVLSCPCQKAESKCSGCDTAELQIAATMRLVNLC